MAVSRAGTVEEQAKLGHQNSIGTERYVCYDTWTDYFFFSSSSFHPSFAAPASLPFLPFFFPFFFPFFLPLPPL